MPTLLPLQQQQKKVSIFDKPEVTVGDYIADCTCSHCEGIENLPEMSAAMKRFAENEKKQREQEQQLQQQQKVASASNNNTGTTINIEDYTPHFEQIRKYVLGGGYY